MAGKEFNKRHMVPGYTPPDPKRFKKRRSEAQHTHALEYYRQKRLGAKLRERLQEED